jgi:dihydroxyacetone kinase-like predicted kinase
VDAVRASATPVGPVRAGQPLALVGGDLVAASDQPLEALNAVCRALTIEDAEVVTLLHGSGTTPEERRAAAELVIGLAPDAEVEVVDAGVAPARFWIGVE